MSARHRGAKPVRPSWWQPPKCRLCLDAPRVPGLHYCPECAAHQERAAEVAKRVNAGRKQDRLSPVEERGKDI